MTPGSPHYGPGTAAEPGRVFYGWYVAFYAFFSNFVSVGCGFYIFNAFMEPLCRARGWTRTDIGAAVMSGMFAGIVSQLFYGTILGRVGPRILMTLGPLVSGIAFIFLFRAVDLWAFYLWCMVLFVGNAAYGGIVANTVVSNWFERKRGVALGISTTGVSLSGAVFPFVAMVVILGAGISRASFFIGIVIAMLSPFAWTIIRNWPEDCGLMPDGDEAPSRKKSMPPSQVVEMSPFHGAMDDGRWTFKDLVRTGTFWKLGLAYGVAMIGIVGVMSQLKPRFVDEGFNDMAGMALMASTAFIGSVGKFLWGALCDRFDPRRIVALLFLFNGIGLSLSLIHGSLPALFLFVGVFGFSMGGVMSTYPFIVAYLFGRRDFPSVTRFVTMFFLLQVSGYVISGRSFDLTGSYDPAYKLYIVLFMISVGLMLTVRRPRKPTAYQAKPG